MANNTNIEWTDATWNALRGCSRVSDGCRHCYAERMSVRFSNPGQWGHGLAQHFYTPAGIESRWTGKVVLDEKALSKPLHWRKPRRIFVTSIGDPFHPGVTDDMLDRLFAVMAICPQHTFQLLTKRPERMQGYLHSRNGMGNKHLCREINTIPAHLGNRRGALEMPLPNLWLGVSVENQAAADERIPHLLATPAAVRFLSCEPLLGPVDWKRWLPSGRPARRPDGTNFIAPHFYMAECRKCGWVGSTESCPPDDEDVICPECYSIGGDDLPSIDWVIAGGESGPKARPMHPDWVRSLRDQCEVAAVPFLFKQWGEWAMSPEKGQTCWLSADGRTFDDLMAARNADAIPPICLMSRPGKKAAGRLLDGREHNDSPTICIY